MSEPAVVTKTSRLVLDVPPDPDQVRTARLFVAAVARHFAVDEERIEDVKVAVSEAVTNSIKAHREAGIADPVRVTVLEKDGELRVSVVDAGPGFNAPEPVTGSAPATPAAGLFEGSLGLELIRSLFPDLSIERNPDRGMTVSFVVGTDSDTPAG